MLFKEIVDGRTHGRTDDGRRTLKDHKSSLSTSCSGELKTKRMDWLVVHVLLAAQPPVKVRLSTCPEWYISIHSELKYARHVPCGSKPTRGMVPTLSRHSSAAKCEIMSSTQSWVVIVAQFIHSCRLGQELVVSELTKIQRRRTRWPTYSIR